MVGGYRPGAGRPKGSKNKPKLRPKYEPTYAPPSIIPDAPTVITVQTPQKYVSGTEWLRQVVNDPNADVVRKDRAAGILAGIEARKSVALGKKEQAEQAADWAGWGTDWWKMLHRENHTPKYPPPDDVQELMREAEMKASQERSEDSSPVAPVETKPPAKPSQPIYRGDIPEWDELLGPRAPKENPPSEPDDTDWNEDLRMPRER
jgi:hypothetical protein